MYVRSTLILIAGLVLAGCKNLTEPEFQRPQQISVCETSYVTICGTWQLSGDGYVGTWQDGATANLQVVHFDRSRMELNREDFGKNQEFSAVYTGMVTGRTATGGVTWNHAGNVRSGTWFAEW